MKRWMLAIGPLLALAMGLCLHQQGLSWQIAWTAGITTLCAVWWIFEPIPIPATSLVPLAVLPAIGVLSPAKVGESYGSHLVLLMLGGFMLSAGMERSGAHRRIALRMVRLCGGSSGGRLVFGFMLASAILSMWISNAATTLMLLPIAMAVIEKVDDHRLQTSLLLGIAYAASIGGIGTPIGTPPNIVFMDNYEKLVGTAPTFIEWMIWVSPIVAIMLPLVAWWLSRGLPKRIHVELPDPGDWRTEERRTLLVFACTALLWITRTQPYGGWSQALGMTGVKDSSVALAAVVVMFLVPNGKGEKLLDWETASKIQWGILILFGGGISIANAFTASGLDQALGQAMSGLGKLPLLAMIGAVCLIVTFLTEITSNTATTTLLLPILAAAATSAQIEPRLIMVPATISASFAFMLPVATPPNAIVFASGKLTVARMAREGLVLNFAGAIVVSLVCYLLFR